MNRIAALRKAQKLSQKEFGSIIGVAQNTISNWENGNREPDFDSALRIADFFRVSVDYLFGRDEEKPAPMDRGGLGETAKHFMGLVDKLTPDQQQLLLAQLQAWTEQNQRRESAARQSGTEKAPGSEP